MDAGHFEQLRVQRVSRRFGDRLALDALDLTISGGEFVALLGQSGCGKSTALNCIAGLLPLTDGSIWLDDRRIDTIPPERRGFGMVFRNYALFPHMSVRRNVGFGLRMRGVGRDETRSRVDEALRLVQLSGYADRLPGQLSGGQQQRVAIARAVVIEPPLVLMDEPLSNLDAALRLEMRTEIRRLHQSLGIDRLLWLGKGLIGDHTDGHVDNLARFVGEGRLALPVATGADDPNAQIYADARARTEAFEIPGRHHLGVVEDLADPGSPLTRALAGG